MTKTSYVDNGDDTKKRGATRPTPIVPQNSISGRTLMLLIAIMTFLSCVTLGAVVLVQKSAIAWSSDVGREVTVQIRPIEGENMVSNLRTIVSIAEAAPGIGAARIISLEESETLLQPWLGAGLDLSVLSIPRLVVVELSDPHATDFDKLALDLATVAGASLDTHSAWRQQLNTMAGTVVIAGLFILGLIVSATVLTIIFATRGTMASNRAIVDVLHFIGASNKFIAGEFQRRFLRIGLRGGIVGGIMALVFFFAIGTIASSVLPLESGAQLSVLFGRFSLGVEGILALAALVPIIAGLTGVTSRITVRRFLKEIS